MPARPGSFTGVGTGLPEPRPAAAQPTCPFPRRSARLCCFLRVSSFEVFGTFSNWVRPTVTVTQGSPSVSPFAVVQGSVGRPWAGREAPPGS